MKNMYESPELEINVFDVEDVVTASGGFNTGDGGTTPVNPFS